MKREFSSMQRFADVATMVLLLAGALLLVPRAARPQANSATYYGTVTDPTGAVVPGAKVTLIAQGTRATTAKITGNSGDFAFSFVPVGAYTLRIEAKGFKAYVATGIVLTAGQQVRQTFHLQLGSAVQTVSVTGSTPLVNTVSAQQTHGYSLTDATQLPLENRNFSGLLKINTGVVPSQNGSGVDMNGIGKNGTVYSLDGTNASGNSGGNNPGVYQGANLLDVMSVEGIQEVSAVKGVIPAEYEDAVGGQVNLVSKSGTNQWHGSAFENHQDSALNARFQRDSGKPRLTFNQFGASLGGPIKRDKIFVFGDYEGYRKSEASFVEGNVPTATVRDQLTAAVPAYQLALQAFPLPNSPTAPGDTVGDFSTTRTQIQRDNHYDVRGDVVLTANSRLTITYNHGSPYYLIPRYFINDPRIYENALDRGSVSYVTGGSNWTSETRFGYDRTIQDRLDQFFTLVAPDAPSGGITYGDRIPDLQTSLGWGGPDGEINHSGGPFWELEEKFALMMGRHSLKFGSDFHHSTGTRNNPQIPDFFYSSMDDLLSNTPSSVTATLGSGIYAGRMYEYGFFAQDDWRIMPKLTLNLGLRYDFYSNFAAHGEDGTAQAGLYNPSFLSMDGNFNVGPFRSPAEPYLNDANNFAPRVGFAYNPDGRGKTSIRAGFGVMFSNIMPEDFWNLVSSAPNVPYRQVFTPTQISSFGIAYPQYNANFFSYAEQLAKTTSATNASLIANPMLRNPYTMQYTFDVQRQVTPSIMFETAFVGTRGVKLPLYRFGNVINRTTGLAPNPNLNQFYYLDNSMSSTYFGWQNSVRKRFSRSLSFDVNYTWSKTLSNGGGDIGSYYQGENSVTNQDFFNLRADRGPPSFDITHYFSADWVYQLPSLSGQNSFVHRMLGEWQATGIVTATTGLPVIVTQSSSTPVQRGEYIGGPAVLPNYTGTLRYLNPAAFQRIPVSPASGAPIQPGNAGPGEWRAPGQWNLDFSLAKNFSLRENLKLQVRADAFNALNHTNLSGLRTSVNDPRFGQLLSTRGARVIQLNARITF
ncbi:MAG TPA: TonB-dependent receptor [Terriglobia bacterium]|nr:TonB-dependent receptor [Terriglobia bacterium]